MAVGYAPVFFFIIVLNEDFHCDCREFCFDF